MKKAFFGPDNILKTHGFVQTNDPGDTAIDVPDEFDLAPGRWKRNGQTWEPIPVPPPPPDEKQARKDRFDALGNSLQDLKDFIRAELL